MGPTGDGVRVLQVHPSLRCNLRCRHCYSLSDPHQGIGLPAEFLLSLIEQAAAEGYNVLSVSGGEPMLYPALTELLDRARKSGMRTMVVSNGMLLDERRLAQLAGLDLLAISIDGVRESHNRIRGSARAFDLMASRLEGVRRTRIPFGFIFTLTQSNAGELEWVAQFAAEQGAQVLHIHPLEEVGRAREEMSGLEPDGIETAVAWLEVLRLRAEYGERLRIHADFVDRRCVGSCPERLLAGRLPDNWQDAPLGELISPLVLEADGVLVPLQYGFHRRFAVGQPGEESLRDLGVRWRRERYPTLMELCRRTYDSLASSEELPIIDWYRLVSRAASENAAAVNLAHAPV